MVMAHQQQHQQHLKQAQQQQVFNSQAQSQQQQQASLIRQQHPQHPAPQQQPQQQQQSSQQQQTRAEAHSPQGPSQAALQLWQLWGNQDRTPQAGEVQVNTFRRLCDCIGGIVLLLLLCQFFRMRLLVDVSGSALPTQQCYDCCRCP